MRKNFNLFSGLAVNGDNYENLNSKNINYSKKNPVLNDKISRRKFLNAIKAFGFIAPTSKILAASKKYGAVVDIMPDFFSAYEKSVSFPVMMDRIKLLAIEFFLPKVDLYTKAGFHGGDQGRLLDDRISDWLQKFDALSAAARRLSAIAPMAWEREQDRFLKKFQDFHFSNNAVFMVSIFSFNAMTRGDKLTSTVFFGIDTIAQQGGTVDDLNVTMTHEIAHLYQSQVADMTIRPELWSRLWSEGLATYTSRILHPNAELKKIYMSDELASVARNNISQYAKVALDNLDERYGPISHSLLDRIDESSSIDRMGYLLGEISVSQAAKKFSISQLFKASPYQAKCLIQKSLSDMV